MSGGPGGRPGLWGPLSGLGLGVALVAALADQLLKGWLILGYDLGSRGRVPVLPFMDLIYVINPGISYGLFPQGSSAGQYLLAGFAVLASLAMAIWLSRTGSRMLAVSLGLIIGGAIGNAIDRVLLGGVADFVSLHALGYSWYIFNLADAWIVVGVAGLLYESLIGSRKSAANTT